MVLGQRLTLLSRPGHRRQRRVDRHRRDHHRGRSRFGRAARAAGVAGRLRHAQLVPDVFGHRRVRLVGRATDRHTARTRRVAAQPLIHVPRGRVGPFTVVLGQRLTLLSRTGNRGHRRVDRHRRHDERGRSRFGRATRAARVAGGLCHTQLVPDVFGDRRVGLVGRATDRHTARTRRVAAQPLIDVPGGRVRPFTVLLGQRLALLGRAGDRRQGRVGRHRRNHHRGRHRFGRRCPGRPRCWRSRPRAARARRLRPPASRSGWSRRRSPHSSSRRRCSAATGRRIPWVCWSIHRGARSASDPAEPSR